MNNQSKSVEAFKASAPSLEDGEVNVCYKYSDKTGRTTGYLCCSRDLDEVISTFLGNGGNFREDGRFVEHKSWDGAIGCNYVTSMCIMNTEDIPESFRPEKSA